MLWIGLAWVLFAAVAVLALLPAVSTVRSAFSGAIPTQRFAAGDVVTVRLDPADEPAIYAGFERPPGVSVGASYP